MEKDNKLGGLATARIFSHEGAKVILFGRQKEKLEKLATIESIHNYLETSIISDTKYESSSPYYFVT